VPSGKDFRWLHVLSRTLFAILGLTLVFVLAGYAINFHTRKRAERLLRDLQTLKIGTSTAEDAMQIVTRYGGAEIGGNPDPRDVAPWGVGPCSGPHQRYGIRVAPDLTNRTVLAVPILQRLGLSIWGVAATIDVKDGKVLCFSQNAGFQRLDGHQLEARAEMIPEALPFDAGQAYAVHSHFIRHYIHEITASVLPDASVDEKTRAFRVELACVTSLSGCVYPCQLAPSVWEDLSERASKDGWTIEGENDPRCQQLLRRP
jgi:hypothetical protein